MHRALLLSSDRVLDSSVNSGCARSIAYRVHSTLPYPGTSVAEGARNSNMPVTENSG